MPKGYRKIKYYSLEEAEKIAIGMECAARQENMVGSHYHAEEIEPGQWVVQHTVLGNDSTTYCKNGILPYDNEPGYLAGYIKNNHKI